MKNITLILIVLIVSACASKSNKVVDKLYYRFPEAQENTHKKFIIARPTALGIIGNRPMIAENSDGALRQMQHNFWLDSPKILLWLYLQKAFSNTANEEDNLSTLGTTLLKLEKKQESAVVAIKFTVKNAENKVIFDKTYNESQALTTNTIASYVKSTSMLIDKIVKQFAEDIQ